MNEEKTKIRISNAIKDSGIRPSMIALELDIGIASVYGWTSCQKMPSLDHLYKLAKLLGCKVDDLLVE